MLKKSGAAASISGVIGKNTKTASDTASAKRTCGSKGYAKKSSRGTTNYRKQGCPDLGKRTTQKAIEIWRGKPRWSPVSAEARGEGGAEIQEH